MAELSWVEELSDPDRPGIIDETAAVRVKNFGPPMRLQWANRWHNLPGDGAEYLMPYHMMVYYCGDPRAFDIPGDPKRRERTEQLRDLCVRYGIYENLSGQTEGLGDKTNFPNWEVYTPSGSQRILTVIDDPEGLNVL